MRVELGVALKPNTADEQGSGAAPQWPGLVTGVPGPVPLYCTHQTLQAARGHQGPDSLGDEGTMENTDPLFTGP